jgi:hypothetical protein
LCCNVPGLDKLGSTTKDANTCESPYIQVGGSCCLDGNDNGICDSDEDLGSASSSSVSSSQGIADDIQPDTVTTDTNPSDSLIDETQTTATTQARPAGASYQCVEAAGYNKDAFIFAYSTNCGSKFIADAETVSSRTGVDVVKVNIGGDLEVNNKRQLLECFYGKYSPQNPEFGSCPRLLCPKTGSVVTLSGKASATVISQMTGFAKNCK